MPPEAIMAIASMAKPQGANGGGASVGGGGGGGLPPINANATSSAKSSLDTSGSVYNITSGNYASSPLIGSQGISSTQILILAGVGLLALMVLKERL